MVKQHDNVERALALPRTDSGVLAEHLMANTECDTQPYEYARLDVLCLEPSLQKMKKKTPAAFPAERN